MRCCASCECGTSVAQLTASRAVRAHTTLPERTSRVRPHVAGAQPPGFTGPYIVLEEVTRETPRSYDLRAAEGGAAFDGASTACRRRLTANAAAVELPLS